ncbi:uncharacterized protein [Chlorocebus sabaeus]|uniref:uncharacterized protein n=1 Tax=Chlorocebus sabaeus TaxID=60711 RepID=UPI0018B0A372|nr:uncharacterized protein LOC119618782 [Chlorocebus sabaeus]
MTFPLRLAGPVGGRDGGCEEKTHPPGSGAGCPLSKAEGSLPLASGSKPVGEALSKAEGSLPLASGSKPVGEALPCSCRRGITAPVGAWLERLKETSSLARLFHTVQTSLCGVFNKK